MRLPSSIPQVVLETPRLLMKELNPEIMDFILTSFGAKELCAYLGVNGNELLTEQDNHRKGLTTYRLSFKNFLMIDKASDVVIGKVGFHTWYLQHARAELGYAVAHDTAKQKGYMTEALPLIIAHGFDHMKLNRIEAFANPHNTPSVRLMQRFGFTQEGLLRGHYFKNGIVEDSACFGLLRGEYYAR